MFKAALPDAIFLKPKIPILVNFGGPCNVRCWYFYGHFAYFKAKWYILCPFGTVCGLLVHFSVLVYFPFWYVVPRKNLATLVQSEAKSHFVPTYCFSLTGKRS
jgi:hypothetical protein